MGGQVSQEGLVDFHTKLAHRLGEKSEHPTLTKAIGRQEAGHVLSGEASPPLISIKSNDAFGNFIENHASRS
eukprot:4810407-Karenia_brevis.AAC.1